MREGRDVLVNVSDRIMGKDLLWSWFLLVLDRSGRTFNPETKSAVSSSVN